MRAQQAKGQLWGDIGSISRVDPVLEQLLRNHNTQTDFRSGGNHDDVGVAIRRLSQNIRTASHTLRRSTWGAVKRWHILPCQNERDGSISCLNCSAPFQVRFVRIAWADDNQLRDRTPRRFSEMTFQVQPSCTLQRSLSPLAIDESLGYIWAVLRASATCSNTSFVGWRTCGARKQRILKGFTTGSCHPETGWDHAAGGTAA